MDRRDFLKSGFLFSGLLANRTPFLNHNDDIDLITDALEKQASLSFSSPAVFKFSSIQKELIRNIYENEKILIVKSRQMGMSTILRAVNELDERQLALHSSLHFNAKHYCDFTWHTYPSHAKAFNLVSGVDEELSNAQIILDDYNCYPTRHRYRNLFQSVIERQNIKHCVIAGSIDNYGNMKWAYDNAERYGYKIFVYPYDKTNFKMENLAVDMTQEAWRREFECKFS